MYVRKAFPSLPVPISIPDMHYSSKLFVGKICLYTSFYKFVDIADVHITDCILNLNTCP